MHGSWDGGMARCTWDYICTICTCTVQRRQLQLMKHTVRIRALNQLLLIGHKCDVYTNGLDNIYAPRFAANRGIIGLQTVLERVRSATWQHVRMVPMVPYSHVHAILVPPPAPPESSRVPLTRPPYPHETRRRGMANDCITCISPSTAHNPHRPTGYAQKACRLSRWHARDSNTLPQYARCVP
jgi:hypothetical protein